MADAVQFVKHIETYVDSSTSPAQQAARVNAIATLVKNDLLTLEALVREMGMYLTTTDNIIRSRGILLLGELLMQLSSKPLEDTAIHSLAGFFAERLADWRASRGALVGCLALVRRTIDVGAVTDSDTKVIAQSYLQNLQVQSMGQHDRKLCFQLLECLLERYPDAVVAVGDTLLYGICEAIDGEKDPQCLMLTFHIVELLAGLFPESSGPLADIAEELFELLGCYFPIHFTHPKNEDVDVKREELSRVLMRAFASTPLFEPFCIPLLFEKLAASLPSAKIESLRYLSCCMPKYGADRMAKYTEALWSSLKEALYISPKSAPPMESDPTGGMGFQDNEITTEALLLLQEAVRNDNGSFLCMVVSDKEITAFINSLAQFQDFSDILIEKKQRLHAVGCILSVVARSSITSCNKVFQSFLPCLMGGLGISVENPSDDGYLSEDYFLSSRVNFGSLYLFVELLDACRSLVLSIDRFTQLADLAKEPWCCMLQNFFMPLNKVFMSVLGASTSESSWNAYIHLGVKGLQWLAMFPEGFLPESKSIYEDILLKLMAILTSNFEKTFLWKSTLTALRQVGLFIGEHHELDKAAGFERIVLENVVSLLASNDHTMPLSLKLQAICEIGMTGQNFALKLLKGLDEMISVKLSEVYVNGDLKSADLTSKVLDCYSSKLLPWFHEVGGSEEVLVSFAANIWGKIDNTVFFRFGFQENELLDATVVAMKQIVGNCSQEGQEMIFHKAFKVLSSGNFSPWRATISGATLFKSEGFKVCHTLDGFSCRDKWITSLFAAVIIALRPQTHIPNIRLILQLFVVSLHAGHIPSAHALGSLLNKLPLRTNIPAECTLEEALDIIFSSCILNSFYNVTAKEGSGVSDVSCVDISSLRLSTPSCASGQVHAIVGLAWIGKGLLMRGHERVKDVIITLMSFLLLDDNLGFKKLKDATEDNKKQELVSLMKSAADAFEILMSDSEVCLNKKYHATIRPLYKQRFFNTMWPILLSSIQKAESPTVRSMLYRALAHIVSDTPLTAILSEARKLIPILLDCLSMLSKDTANNNIVYSVLLVISGILMDKNGKEAVVEHALIIVKHLIGLVSYPYMMVIRETAVQCLVAMSELPHATIYPLRAQVLRAITKALDDPKRVVRQEAVKCRQAWLEYWTFRTLSLLNLSVLVVVILCLLISLAYQTGLRLYENPPFLKLLQASLVKSRVLIALWYYPNRDGYRL